MLCVYLSPASFHAVDARPERAIIIGCGVEATGKAPGKPGAIEGLPGGKAGGGGAG